MVSKDDVAGAFTLPTQAAGTALFRKIAWRLMPFLFICYLVAQVDRMNVAFAKLEMLDQLGFSETVYGLGAGIFFIGYVLFEVPSNLLLKRFGAHRWIARIMISWGLISAGMMFVQTPTQFYVMRFLLGVAEAGFFPGVIYYLTDWFTREYRTRMTAIFMTAIAVAGVVVGPVSGAILHSLVNLHGIAGWQWLFLIEGVPSVVLGVITLFYLPPSPERATFLDAAEKRQLASLLSAERVGVDDAPAGRVLRAARVWILSGIYGCYGMSFFGFVFWLPTIIKSSGVTDPLSIGLLSAIPWAVAMVAMCLVAAFVDRRQNTRPVLMWLSLFAAIGWAASPSVAHSVPLSMLVLSLAMFGLMASLPVFWNLPTASYQGKAAALAIAFITSLGNVPGFFSPYIVGWIRTLTHRMDDAMYLFAAVSLLAVVLLALLSDKSALRSRSSVGR
ncbi:MFS transporter [Pandoraea cepalis]|uniref:MFS transporter n=1 Tax=Pandoraea cepalis TaxID=2508294 RepID=A0A5E4VVY0_9BURK|nr:MFS transporter [Pandoraea cepalis]VVE16602.1 MFS transporter [Pandoraea cepalis]